MRYCTNCGNELTENAAFCSRCGTAVEGNNNHYNNNAYNSYNPNYGYQQPVGPKEDDKSSFLFALLGFLVPVAGIVLYFIWKNDYPKRGKSALKGAITAIAFSVAFFIAFFIFFALIGGSAMTEMYYYL